MLDLRYSCFLNFPGKMEAEKLVKGVPDVEEETALKPGGF